MLVDDRHWFSNVCVGVADGAGVDKTGPRSNQRLPCNGPRGLGESLNAALRMGHWVSYSTADGRNDASRCMMSSCSLMASSKPISVFLPLWVDISICGATAVDSSARREVNRDEAFFRSPEWPRDKRPDFSTGPPVSNKLCCNNSCSNEAGNAVTSDVGVP